MKMKAVWKLLPKVYEMGIQDGLHHEDLKEGGMPIDPDIQLSDHPRHKEVIEMIVDIRGGTWDGDKWQENKEEERRKT